MLAWEPTAMKKRGARMALPARRRKIAWMDIQKKPRRNTPGFSTI
jgi:hypothetical protein